MSKEVEVVKPNAFQAMQNDIQVSMDDVVSAFVSQYEKNLYARKKELAAVIRDEEKLLDNLKEELLKRVNGDEWAKEKLPFGLKLNVSEGKPDYEDKVVHFEIKIQNAKKDSYYHNTLTVSKTKPIPAGTLNAREKILVKLDDLRRQLSEVLVNIKSINRKEREVRGRLAMRKLEDSGYADLMNDVELVKLVQLED